MKRDFVLYFTGSSAQGCAGKRWPEVDICNATAIRRLRSGPRMPDG